MSIASRIELYAQIEQKRNRPLIVYVTSERDGASGRMGADVIPEICDQISLIPSDTKAVDVLIVSTGGDIMVAWRTISMLREKVKHISVLVPQMAYSAATLLALGADEIVMHPFANLGPIDPQISVTKKDHDGKPNAIHFGSEDMEGFLDFAKTKVGLADQVNMKDVFMRFCEEVGPVTIGFAARSSQLSQQLGVKLLGTRLRRNNDERKAKSIVDALHKKYFNHGYALSRSEAKEIGLNVKFPDEELSQLLWATWIEIEKDLKCRTPFDPMRYVRNDPRLNCLFAPLPYVDMPINTPPPFVEGLWQQILSKVAKANLPNLDYIKCCALLESTRAQKMYIEKGIISACRIHNGGIGINVTRTQAGWDTSVDEAL